MQILVVKPVGQAWDWMVSVLFRPFNIGKWFIFGFAAFLIGLGESSGGSGNIRIPSDLSGFSNPNADPQMQEFMEKIKNTFQEYLVPIIIGAVLLLLLIITLWLVFQWLSCRGRFIFLHGVVTNKAEIAEPWRQFRTLGNSYWGFRIVIILLSSLLTLFTIALFVWIAWPDIEAKEFGERSIVSLAVGIPVFLLILLTFLMVIEVSNDFVVPIMYCKNTRVTDAWGIFWHEIMPGHIWVLTLFYLMKFVLAIAIVTIIAFVGLVTCCIGFILLIIPYIGQVVLLPITVLMQCYPLFFLQQFGEQWKFFPSSTITDMQAAEKAF